MPLFIITAFMIPHLLMHVCSALGAYEKLISGIR